jgi:hypothetical protein
MPKYTEDENGYITIPKNPISKSGVFQYLGSSISPELDPNKVYNVYRPEKELNNPDTIESFRLTPWIPEHVMLGDGYTPAEMVGVQGVTGETVDFSDGVLYSKLKLFGDDLKKLIKAGLKELSCGFRCSWEIKSGTHKGEHYDAIQTNIRGNHLASVENARMGNDVRVAMDKAVFALDSINYNSNLNGETMLLEEVQSAIDEAIKPLKRALDAAEKKVEDMEKKAEDMPDFIKKKIDAKKEKSAEDMEKEKKAAEDKEAKDMKDKEKSEAMDSALKSLQDEVKTLKSTAMDGNTLIKAHAEKQALANQVSQIVGAFDHADLDAQGVAEYALGKMGIACDSGQELPMMKGILLSRQAPTFTVDNGQKHAIDGKDDPLKDTGL